MRTCLLCLLVLLLISIGGVVSSDTTNSAVIPALQNANVSSSMKLPELVTYVNEAADYARSVGKEEALREFNDVDGKFTQNDIYIFAYDFRGTTLALPYEPQLIGKNRMSDTDVYGNQMIAEFVDVAENGGGIVTYYYPDPGMDMTILQKNSYITPVDETWLIGAGIYSPRTLPAPVAEIRGTNPDASQLQAFVESAAAFAREQGKDAAIAAFSDPNSPFIQDGMYIVAYDTNTTNLAHPYQPWIQGLCMRWYRDIDNVQTVDTVVRTAVRGAGFSHSVYRIFIDNKSLYIPKIDYTIPMDEDWLIGAGTIHPEYVPYKTGDLAGLVIREGTVQELVSLVDNAVSYAKEHGKEETLSVISDPDGIFTTENVWLFAGDRNATLLADPYLTDSIGKSILDFSDSYHTKTTEQALDLIASGGGFVHGMFPDTRTSDPKEIPKLMYLKPVDEDWWIAGGLYGVFIQ